MQVKDFRSVDEQVEILSARGMGVGRSGEAQQLLSRVSYYRLSGYWHPFRQILADGRPGDIFYPGTELADVVALYDFDARLRAATFSVLTPVEIALRAMIGHALGRLDPCAHLKPHLLGAEAATRAYLSWRQRYESIIDASREDFVQHHVRRYGGTLPVWSAVEVLDWGGLTYLYGFAPRSVQDEISGVCGLSSPQLRSWLKALNVVRNTCAHHGRLFNRVHALTPKLPTSDRAPDLLAATTGWNRTFGQLSLIQFLLRRLSLGRTSLLPAVIRSYPQVNRVPPSRMGVGPEWATNPLWSL